MKNRWYVLAILTLVYATNIGDRYLLSALVEPIKSDLGLTDSALGFLTGFAFALLYTILGFPMAYVADRWNRRNLIVISVTAYSVMTAACGFAQNLWQLILARVGVGIGEAGATPPSHSIISNLFSAEQRGFALSVFALGASIGVSAGLYFGGLVNELWGWRYAFIFMAVPGIALAILTLLTVREPLRTLQHAGSAEQSMPDIAKTARFMWSQRSLRHLLLGGSVFNIYAIALTIFMPAFMVRSHGMSVRDASEALALLYGIGGAIGLLGGGYISDRMGRTDVRWHAWVTIVVIGVSIVPTLAIFYLPPGNMFYACQFVFGIANYMFLGPLYAMVQNLVGANMRAMGAALLLFALNFIGQGFGPQAAGVLSDVLATTFEFGNESLRYSLFAIALVSPFWGIWHYALATRSIAKDYDSALAT